MKKIMWAVCMLMLWIAAGAQDPPYQALPAAPQNIVKAEYFIDTDPGFGNGVNIALTPGVDLSSINVTVNTTGLGNGPHQLYVRSLNAEGKWSQTVIHEFLLDFDPAYNTIPSPQNILQAEYFIDTDPGIGNGNAVPLTAGVDINNLAATINTTGLAIGTHRLYLRTRSNEGRWSITTVREFLVDLDPPYPVIPPAPQNIIQAEYFINTDPGPGNGSAIAHSPGMDLANVPVSINTSGLPPGSTNRVYVRSLNAEGRWSITAFHEFLVALDPAYPAAPPAPANLTAAEYFIDTDPGFGNGQTIALTPSTDIGSLAFTVNTTSLSNGPHTLYVRSFAPWGITAYTNFNIGTILPLRFLSFAANSQPLSVDLEWMTADEVNTSHFIVERSLDARSWKGIGKVTSRNSPGIHSYVYSDSSPHSGTGYYRVKQVDLDSQFVYSKTLMVTRNAGSIRVFPNPAGAEINVMLQKPAAEVEISVYDAFGRMVSHQRFTGATGILRLSLQGLAKGGYLLKVKADGEQWNEVIQKN